MNRDLPSLDLKLSLMKTERTRDAWRKSVLPILVIVIGALLLAIKVYVDSEPGAIPLLLVAGGQRMVSSAAVSAPLATPPVNSIHL